MSANQMLFAFCVGANGACAPHIEEEDTESEV